MIEKIKETAAYIAAKVQVMPKTAKTFFLNFQ